MNVLLMFGGKSLESDVSVVSALYVYNLIKDDSRYNKVLVYADYDNVLYTCSELTDIKNYQHLNKLLTKTNEIALLKTSEATILKSHKKSLNGLKIDLILPIMHGEGLEDGIIAGYTKFLQIPSVCPNVLEASMFQDKYITKLLLEKINIKTLAYQLLTKQNQNVTLNLPIIIKPLSLGSSIGITTVTNEQALTKKLQESFTYSNKLLIEPLIENFTEYSLALYKYKDNIYLSNVEKSYTNNEFYTFEDKYLTSKRVKLPIDLNEEEINQIILMAKNIYNSYFEKGIIRIDFLKNQTTNQIYVCEVNTIPGNLSLNMFKNKGIDVKEVIYQNILQALWLNYQNEKNLTQRYKSTILTKTKLASKK